MIQRYETFTVLMAKINRNIRKIKNREMAGHDLRSAHVSCLYYLYRTGNLTATDLCERCEEDKATISRAVAHLEEAGYVTCRAEGEKRYKSPLALTEKGCAAGAEIAQKVDRILDTVGAGLTEEERSIFYRCLSVISENLETVANQTEK